MTESTPNEVGEQEEISPNALADRLAAGGELPVLIDVRVDPEWAIEAPALELLNIPVEEARARVPQLAGELDGPIVVVCARGKMARIVAAELREAGADAVVLEGGMSGWLQALQDRDVDVDLPAGAEIVQIQRPGRGCLSYLVAAGKEALVVDPAPDTAHYLELAERLGAEITDVVDTHLHADHISGARELASRAGARLRLPRAALERGVAYEGDVTPLDDGDRVGLGDLVVTAVALPGHTTDMTGLLVADRALIAGDSLFAEGIARPDLQRGDPEGARTMARRLFTTIHERVLGLGDDVILLPGHTDPGVLAGAVAPEIWRVEQANPLLGIIDPDEFAEALLEAMPPRPANYETIIAVNSGRAVADPDLETGGNSCSTGAVPDGAA